MIPLPPADKELVLRMAPEAVCHKNEKKIGYTVYEKEGGKVIALAYSAKEAWKNARINHKKNFLEEALMKSIAKGDPQNDCAE